MAIIAEKNNLLSGVRGRIGNLVVSQRKEKTVLSARRGAGSKPPTDAQRAVLSRFSECSAYARAACSNLQIKAAYQAVAELGRSAYQMAMKDAFHGPVVHDISRCDNSVIIEATDNFKVKWIKVEVFDEYDELIEEGDAVAEEDDSYWKYELNDKRSAIPGVKFVVIAYDFPGNATEAEIIM